MKCFSVVLRGFRLEEKANSVLLEGEMSLAGVNILQTFPIIIGEKFPQNVRDIRTVCQLEGFYFVSRIDLGKSFQKSSGKG